ncbi:MAG: hypothetical protein GC202_14280 [Alphaproteobacteria bacterium]|nr:hypothetical protein [Alphaproteobacteria bacterium]
MPVTMPDYGFEGLELWPDLGIRSARSEGGLIVTSRRSDPFIAGRMTTGPLNAGQYADFRAWLLDAIDNHRKVDFVHPRLVVPRSYTVASLPWDGSGTVTAVTDLRTLVMSGLEVGAVLKRGDLFSVTQGSLVAARFVSADTTVASNIAQSIPLIPRLPIGVFAAGATVSFLNPVMRLMIVPGSQNGAEAYGPTPVSFDVAESLS